MATSRRPEALRRREVDPADARGARVAALDALARREHASGELKDKLLERGYAVEVVDGVIAALHAERLLDDRRYVENFVAYHAGRGQGPLRIRAELGRFALPKELVEEAIDAYPDWLEQVRAVRRKKFGESAPQGFAERQRQARFLGYRGFTGTQIRTALGLEIDLNQDL